ncbi:MAG: hypothetical protein P8I60_06760, partial [Flavobacteriaceae bacterium]|nr:hypothetical protein [Flavobacteriaceae bacterium]
MKKILLILLFVPLVSFGQNGFNYQGIISNSDGTIVSSQTISVRLSLIYDSTNGTVAYSELHSPTTGANGLINLKVGTGAQLSSAGFSSVDWSTAYIYLKSEIDITGSGIYVDVGTDLIGQVPVALFAKQLEGITITNGTVSATAFVGDGSGLTNVSAGVTDDSNNVIIGNSALASNTLGSTNVAVGQKSLEKNTTNSSLTALGAYSLSNVTSNTTGLTAVGFKVLEANTIGAYNSGFGNEALISNTTGSNNTAIGVNASRANQSSNNNTAVGYNALFANTGA